MMKDSFSANRLLANPTSYSLGAPSDGKASRTPASWRSATASACSCGPASTAAPPGSRWLSRFTAPSHFDFEARPGHGARSSLFVSQETGQAIKKIWNALIFTGMFGPIKV